MVLANRAGTKANRKGEPVWLRGVFLCKTDNNLFIARHMDGIKTSRSAKRCTEHFDIKGISSVGLHAWEVKHTTLTTRAIPRKNIPGPPSQEQPAEAVAQGPAPGSGVIQGGASGAKQGPTRTTYLEGKARKEQAEHKRKAEEELEQEYLEDEAGTDPSSSSNTQSMDAASETGSQELIPDSAKASDLLSARGPAPLRKLEFEDVGTPSVQRR